MEGIFLCNRYRDNLGQAQECIERANGELDLVKLKIGDRREIEELIQEGGEGLIRIVETTKLSEYAIQFYPVNYKLEWTQDGTNWNLKSLWLKPRKLTRKDLDYPQG